MLRLYTRKKRKTSSSKKKHGKFLEQKQQAEQSSQVRPRPLQVGKASVHDPKIPQPAAARRGIVPKVPFRLLLSGASGSGKTNVARWMLDKHYVRGQGSWFHRIVLFSPTAEIDPIWKDLKGLKKKDRMTECSAAKLDRILKDCEKQTKSAGKEKGKHTLILLDDVIAESKFIHSGPFLAAFIRARHFNCSVIVMTQSYVKIPRSARIQASHIIMFPSQTTEIERLYSEYGPHNMKKRDFFKMVVEATTATPSEPFPFIYIDRQAPIEKRFRRNLDMFLKPAVTGSDVSKIELPKRDKWKPQ